MAEREAGLMSALDDSIKFNSPTEAFAYHVMNGMDEMQAPLYLTPLQIRHI